jgi:hypothetical protein
MTGVLGVAQVLRVGAPFVWLGAVLAISFLEAPVKFRAPGITVALGLGIGRLVFRALNIAECVLALMLTVAVMLARPGVSSATWALVIGGWAVLLAQIAGLRPVLDRRARRLLAGESVPRSRLHLTYVGTEIVKVVVLAVLGCLLALEPSS